MSLQTIVRRRCKKPGQLELAYGAAALKRGIPKRESLQVVMGHFRFGFHRNDHRPADYITFLRDPVQQVVSHYNYTFDHPQKFENDPQNNDILSFARGPYGYNLQTRFIAGINNLEGREEEALQTAKENLVKHFGMIGISEYFDRSILMIGRYLGWWNTFYVKVNRGKKRSSFQLSAAERRELEDILQYDIRLYQFALQLFHNQINKERSLAIRLRAYRAGNWLFRKVNPAYIAFKRLFGLIDEQ